MTSRRRQTARPRGPQRPQTIPRLGPGALDLNQPVSQSVGRASSNKQVEALRQLGNKSSIEWLQQRGNPQTLKDAGMDAAVVDALVRVQPHINQQGSIDVLAALDSGADYTTLEALGIPLTEKFQARDLGGAAEPPPVRNIRINGRINPAEAGFAFGEGDVIQYQGELKRIEGMSRTPQGRIQIFFTDGKGEGEDFKPERVIASHDDPNARNLARTITSPDGRTNLMGKPVADNPPLTTQYQVALLSPDERAALNLQRQIQAEIAAGVHDPNAGDAVFQDGRLVGFREPIFSESGRVIGTDTRAPGEAPRLRNVPNILGRLEKFQSKEGYDLAAALREGVSEAELKAVGFASRDIAQARKAAQTQSQAEAERQPVLERLEQFRVGENSYDLVAALSSGVSEVDLARAGFGSNDIARAMRAAADLRIAGEAFPETIPSRRSIPEEDLYAGPGVDPATGSIRADSPLSQRAEATRDQRRRAMAELQRQGFADEEGRVYVTEAADAGLQAVLIHAGFTQQQIHDAREEQERKELSARRLARQAFDPGQRLALDQLELIGLADAEGRVFIPQAIEQGQRGLVLAAGFTEADIDQAQRQQLAMEATARDLGIREEEVLIGESVRTIGPEMAEVEAAIEGRRRELLSTTPGLGGMVEQDDRIQELRQRERELRSIQERILSRRLTPDQGETLARGELLPVDPGLSDQIATRIEALRQQQQEFQEGAGLFGGLSPEGQTIRAESITPEYQGIERQIETLQAIEGLVETGFLSSDEAFQSVAAMPEGATEADVIAARRNLGQQLQIAGAFPAVGLPVGVTGTILTFPEDSPAQIGFNFATDILGAVSVGGGVVRGARGAGLLRGAGRGGAILRQAMAEEIVGTMGLFTNPVQLARATAKQGRIVPVTAARTDYLPLISFGRLESTGRIPAGGGEVIARPATTLPMPQDIVRLLSPEVEKAEVLAATRRVAQHSDELADIAEAAGNLDEAADLRQAAARTRARGESMAGAVRSDVLRVRDELTRALVEGSPAEVSVGSVSELGQLGVISARPSRLQKVLGRALLHGVKDGRNFMIDNLIPLGRERRGLFTTPELYLHFTRQTASGREVPLLPRTKAAIEAGKLPDEEIRSIVLFTDDGLIDAALKSRGTGLYQPVDKFGRPMGPRVAEIEETIPPFLPYQGASQILYTHDVDGTVLRVLVVGPSLTRAQIVKMKFLAPQDLLENVFRPAMWFTPSPQAQARLNRGIELGKEVGRLVDRAEAARVAGRADEAAELLVQADRRADEAAELIADAQRASLGAVTRATPAVLYFGDRIAGPRRPTEGLADGRGQRNGFEDFALPERVRLDSVSPLRRDNSLLSALSAEKGEIIRLASAAREGRLNDTQRQQADRVIDDLSRAPLTPDQQQRVDGQAEPIRANEPRLPAPETRVPGDPATPRTPATPRVPGVPESPRIPTVPRAPGTPDIPGVPDIPNVPPPKQPPGLPGGDPEASERTPGLNLREIGLARGAVGDTSVNLVTGETRTLRDIPEVPNRPTKETFIPLDYGEAQPQPQKIPWGAFDLLVFPDGTRQWIPSPTKRQRNNTPRIRRPKL